MEKENRGLEQAQIYAEEITKIMQKMEKAQKDNKEKEIESLEQKIDEMPLAVNKVKKYIIELATGGPAVRITGDLSKYNEPETAQLEYQDWFTAWKKLPLQASAYVALLEFAQRFYFED